MSSIDPEAWFAAAPEGQHNVLLELRGLIMEVDPTALEAIKWGRPCYANARGLFCYLHSTKTHATLGFQQGATLDDPDGLLEGTGKDQRHVKFDARRALDPEAVLPLLRQAATR